jgi:hypothetical protein
MTTSPINTYQVAVIERALAFYEVEAEDARTAAEDWQDGEFEGRDDEALAIEGPCGVRERRPDGTWRKVPKSEWQGDPFSASRTGLKPYSVLLLYPDYANDSGTETYYAFVEAADPIDAVAIAQRQAAGEDGHDPDDYAPLLVIEGHHYGQPLFNK